jgi:serine/threonine-protein kinase HipA
MTSELVVLLGGEQIGRVRRNARGRLTLVYDSNWREARDAYPLSLSMPVTAQEHGPAAVEAYLGGSCPTTNLSCNAGAGSFKSHPGTSLR